MVLVRFNVTRGRQCPHHSRSIQGFRPPHVPAVSPGLSAFSSGLYPGTQLDDPRPGQPLRVGIFTSHFFARCPLFCSPLACIQWSSDRFLRDGSGLVQHKASRPGAGTLFHPTPTGYLEEIEARDSGSVTHLQQLPSGTEAPVAWACDDHETRRPRSLDPLCGLVSIT